MTKHTRSERHRVLLAMLAELRESRSIIDVEYGDVTASYVEWTNRDLSLMLGVDDDGAYVTLMNVTRDADSIAEAVAIVRAIFCDEVIAVAGYDNEMLVYADLAPWDAPTRGIGKLDGVNGGPVPPINRFQVCSWSGKLDYDTAKETS